MKRNKCFLALLCLFFQANAQEVRIGDKVPDIRITGLSGLVLNGKPVGEELQFSALKGKLVIFDFWATWCAPCRQMVPVMDSLQKMFGDQMVVLPVAYESAEKVAPVLAEMQRLSPFSLPGVTGDKLLVKLFPHRALPHYVWIDGTGTVAAITEEKEVTAANIRKVLAGSGALPVKQDAAAVMPSAAPTTAHYAASLSGYIPSLKAGMDIYPMDSLKGQRFQVRNVPLLWLFRMAYSDHGRWYSGSRVRLLTRDSAQVTTRRSGQDYERWLREGNGWTYELQVPPRLVAGAYTLMQEDMKRLFPQYEVGVAHLRTRCLVLVRTSREDKLRAKPGGSSAQVGPYTCELRNVSLGQLVKRLQVQFLEGYPLPVVDGTNYSFPVDLSLHAPMNDVQAMNLELARYDLRFVEKEALTDLLVVSDRN